MPTATRPSRFPPPRQPRRPPAIRPVTGPTMARRRHRRSRSRRLPVRRARRPRRRRRRNGKGPMRHRAILILCCLTIAAPAVAARRAAVPAQLEKIERDLAQASVRNDPAPYDRYWCDDFLGVAPDGSTYSKAEHRATLTGGKIHFRSLDVDRVKVRVYGNAAVMTSRRVVRGDFDGHPIDA